MHIKQSQ